MENPEFIQELDFIPNLSEEQIIEFLRGESLNIDQSINNITEAAQNPEFFFGDDILIGGLIVEDEEFVVNPTEPNIVGNYGGPDQHLAILSDICDEVEQEENSSGTVTNSGSRSRTLVAERKRRGRMKEKLYALRALVPNITKMDKASIVGDAVMYMEDLQRQAKMLKAEIQDLESSQRSSHYHTTQNPASKMSQRENFIFEDHHEFYSKPASLMKILQMEVFQVEERGFYIRVVCGKGDGVAVTLYKALETLPRFHVQSSNFSTNPESLIFTVTLHDMSSSHVEEVNATTLKIWLVSTFLNHGFELQDVTNHV